VYYDQVRAAIQGLTREDLLRLKAAARSLDKHRYEDLYQEAIAKTLSGERRWRTEVSFSWHLHGCMASIAWNWRKKPDENLLLESQLVENTSEAGVFARLEAATADPERQLSSKTQVELIVEACRGDEVVLALIEGGQLGKSGAEIRKELNLSDKGFKAAAQRLRRTAKKIIRARHQYA